MRRRERLLAGFLLLMAWAGGGCTTQAWYEATKAARNECRRQPPGDSEACLSRVNPLTYEEYERQRSGRKPQYPDSRGE
jgi:hypothetical protein